jgi:hypothetical protein
VVRDDVELNLGDVGVTGSRKRSWGRKEWASVVREDKAKC